MINIGNLVCSERDDEVEFVFSCPEYGPQGSCSGRTTGSCGCSNPAVCNNGDYKCENECNCNSGFYECDNHVWKLRPMARKYQK